MITVEVVVAVFVTVAGFIVLVVVSFKMTVVGANFCVATRYPARHVTTTIMVTRTAFTLKHLS